MKKLTLIFIFIFMMNFVFGEKNNPENKEQLKQVDEKQQKELYTLQAGKGNKYINSKTTYNDLVKLFGKENVIKGVEEREYDDTKYYYVELFPGSIDRARIYFWDKNYRRAGRIAVYYPSTLWKLNGTFGIQLGTTLEELEKLYGNVFYIQMTSYDMITNWYFYFDKSKNKIINEENFLKNGFSIKINPTNEEISEYDEEKDKALWSGEKLKSNEKYIKDLKIVVSEITIYL